MRGDPSKGSRVSWRWFTYLASHQPFPARFRMDTTACSCPDLVHGPCLEAKLLKTADMTALGVLFV